MYKLIIPASYWVLTLLWLVILGLYLIKLKQSKAAGGAVAVLLTILAIDAFRTLFESFYFGLYFNSLFGLLPRAIFDSLSQPGAFIIPKLTNIVAGITVLVLLLQRWIPRELREREELIRNLKQSEEQARREKQQLAEVLWGTNAGIWSWNIQTDEHVYSESWADLLGYTLAELTPYDTRSWKGLLHPEDVEMATNLLDKNFLQELDYFECELRLRHKDGHWVWVLDRGKVAEWSDAGKPLRMSGTIVEITARKTIELAAARQHAEFEAIFNSISDAIVFVDPQRQVQRVNPAFIHMFGYQPEEVIGQTTQLIYADPNNYTTQGNKRFNPQSSTKSPIFETKYRRKNGSIFTGETLGPHVCDENGNLLGYLGVVRDISQRKEAEQERMLLLSAIEQAAETIVITDKDGNIQYANPAFEKISGFSCAEALGKNPRILKSGEQDKQFYQKLWDTIIKGEVWNGRLINKKKNGEFYTEEATISPVLNIAGEIGNFIAVKRDVSAELELEKQMMQGQKLEIIGTLASGIAHDFNNILAPILGYSQLMMEKKSLDQEDSERLKVILTSATRAKDLVEQILNFSRHADDIHQPLQLKPQIEETLNLLRASIPASVELSIDLQNLQILAPSAKVHQLVLNLCTNAAQAMHKTGGQIAIKMKKAYLKPDNWLHLPPGDYAHLTIQDNGPGIAPEVLPQIFNPYFTTKEVGEGSGIGLATVQRIISNLGGLIKVESSLGQGTRFHVLLPTSQAKEPVNKSVTKLMTLPQGKQHILLVDDEDYLVSLTSEFLQNLGYTVTGFTHSHDAIRAVEEQPDRFDLLLTDLTMPQIDGLELAKRVGEINPELPVILGTGQLSPLTDQELGNIKLLKTLKKPDILTDLAFTLHQYFSN